MTTNWNNAQEDAYKNLTTRVTEWPFSPDRRVHEAVNKQIREELIFYDTTTSTFLENCEPDKLRYCLFTNGDHVQLQIGFLYKSALCPASSYSYLPSDFGFNQKIDNQTLMEKIRNYMTKIPEVILS
jgi:hypothetical protein